MKVKNSRSLTNSLKTAEASLSANIGMKVGDLRQNTGWWQIWEILELVCLWLDGWKWSVLSFQQLWWGHGPVTCRHALLVTSTITVTTSRLSSNYPFNTVSDISHPYLFCLSVSVSQSLSVMPDLSNERIIRIRTKCHVVIEWFICIYMITYVEIQLNIHFYKQSKISYLNENLIKVDTVPNRWWIQIVWTLTCT